MASEETHIILRKTVQFIKNKLQTDLLTDDYYLYNYNIMDYWRYGPSYSPGVLSRTKFIPKTKERYIISFLFLLFGDSVESHANLIIIDTVKKIYWIYEPHGSYRVHDCLVQEAKTFLLHLHNTDEKEEYVYAENIGAVEQQFYNKGPYCLLYCMQYIDEHFLDGKLWTMKKIREMNIEYLLYLDTCLLSW